MSRTGRTPAAKYDERPLKVVQSGEKVAASILERLTKRLADMDVSRFMFWLFLVALLIRVLAVWALRHISQPPGFQMGADGIDFDHLGRALAQGRGFVWDDGTPTSFRAPGFPAFLAVIYAASHTSFAVAYISLCMLGATACVLTYLLAKEVLGESLARVAGVLSMMYLPTIQFCTVWASEALFVPCFASSIWLFLTYLRTGSYKTLGLAGMTLGWSILTRPFSLVCIPIFIGFLMLRTIKPAFACSVLLMSSLVPVSIWTMRNYHVHHAFVLVTTNGGSTFYGANNDIVLRTPAYMGGWVTTRMLPGREVVDAAPNEVVQDKIQWRQGAQWLQNHLSAIPVLVIMKLCRFVLPDIDSSNKKYVFAAVVGSLPYLLLCFAGIRRLIRCSATTPQWLLLHLAFAATVLTAVVFWGSPRFRDANSALLMVYAAWGTAAWLPSDPNVSSGLLMSKSGNSSKRLRIALVIDRVVGWTAGGTERQLAWLFRSLDRTIFEPVLFVLEGTPALEADRSTFQVCVLNSRPRWFNLKLLYDLRKELSCFGPQIVQGFFYDATVFGVVAARLAGVRVVVQSRRSVGYAQLGFLRQIVLRCANLLTTSWQCNSRFVAASISRKEGIPEHRIAIFPNILDPEGFSVPKAGEREAARHELGLPIDAPIFICVSNLRPIKDLTTLVRAAARVHQQLSDAQFVIVGEGPILDVLRREIDQLELNGIVWIVGCQANIRTWLVAADMGILTSWSEGSSNALLEYMAIGLPTIVSDIPANRELVDQQLFRTGDSSDLAAKILSLWADVAGRSRIRDANKHRIEGHKPEIVMKRLQRYYLELAAKHLHG